MKKKALTLAEVLIALLVVSLGIGGMFMVYPTLHQGVGLVSQKIRAWEAAKQTVEHVKILDFDNDLWSNAYDPDNPPSGLQPQVFFASGNPPLEKASSVYYIEKVETTDGTIADDFVRVTAVVSFAAGNRVIGEDQNFNGQLDSGEDQDGNGILNSSVSLTIFIVKKED